MYLQLVLKRTIRRTIIKTGEVTGSIIYGITSLPHDKADTRTLERLWRVHRVIENLRVRCLLWMKMLVALIGTTPLWYCALFTKPDPILPSAGIVSLMLSGIIGRICVNPCSSSAIFLERMEIEKRPGSLPVLVELLVLFWHTSIL